jgi:hypothetical protein
MIKQHLQGVPNTQTWVHCGCMHTHRCRCGTTAASGAAAAAGPLQAGDAGLLGTLGLLATSLFQLVPCASTSTGVHTAQHRTHANSGNINDSVHSIACQ